MSFRRANERVRESLSSNNARLARKIDPGTRLTVPKLGEQVQSGIYKRQDRIDLKDLERAYRIDELVFGIINKYITVITGGGYTIKSKKISDANKVTDWLKDSGFDFILKEVIRDLFVFGFSFVEKVYNKYNTHMVRLASIDTKTMDFKRDTYGNIIVDKWGLPVGYEQSLWTTSVEGQFAYHGNEDTHVENTRNIPTDKIAFFRLFNTSGEVVGISPIECLYNIITWRKNIDWAMGEGAFTYAAPPIVVNAGTDDMPVSADDLEGLSEDMSDISPQSVFVVPWHVKVSRIESTRGMTELTNFSDNFKVAICNALMMPPSLMGIGRTTARGIAHVSAEWERTVKCIQDYIGYQVREQIFRPLADQLSMEDIPEIVWNPISASIALSDSRRRSTYARSGLLNWTPKLENYIRKQEGLPSLTSSEAKEVALQKVKVDDAIREMIRDIIEEEKSNIDKPDESDKPDMEDDEDGEE